jgi:signal transduction histidine kinase
MGGKGATARAGSAARISEAGRGAEIAFLVVDGSGKVIRARGWEAVTGRRAPARLPASGDDSRSLEAAVAAAVRDAGRTGAPVLRRAPNGGGAHAPFSIAAGSLGSGRAARRTAVMVEPRSEAAPGRTTEGQAIRKLGHDLRSPLTSISGAVELLQSGRLGDVSEQQARCLGVLQRGIDNLLEVLEKGTAPYRPDDAEDPMNVLDGLASKGGTAR